MKCVQLTHQYNIFATTETRVLIGCNAGNRELPASYGRMVQTAAAYRSCYLIAVQLGIELTTSRSRVWCPNHCATKVEWKQMDGQTWPTAAGQGSPGVRTPLTTTTVAQVIFTNLVRKYRSSSYSFISGWHTQPNKIKGQAQMSFKNT